MRSFRTPSLRRHKGSCQGIVTLNGRDFFLGPWPATARTAPLRVRKNYDKLIAEWLASESRLPALATDESLTITTHCSLLAPLLAQHQRHTTKRGHPWNTVQLARVLARVDARG